MANVHAVHSIGAALAALLRNTYPRELNDRYGCAFEVFSSARMNRAHDDATTVSLFLYRVTLNEHLRNAPRASAGGPSLPLELHWLVTVWADSAETEHTILTWVMRQLHRYERLTASDLSDLAGWRPEEVVQIVPAELSTEDMMRIWDALEPPYRLSVSYIARVARIDPETVEPEPKPVVARRIDIEPMPEGGRGA